MSNDLIRFIPIAALMGFMVYRRVRRSIGRQPLHRGRMMFRIVLFVAICVVLVASHGLLAAGVAAVAAGFTAGAVLGFYAVRHTHFEFGPAGAFYTPNRYIGLGVSVLFIGRIAYRLLTLRDRMNEMQHADVLSTVRSNPTTLGLYFLLAGYYIVYYAGLLRRRRPGTSPEVSIGAAPLSTGDGN